MIKYLIISRVALDWKHPNRKLNWEKWVKDRLRIFDNYTRPSLKAQTDQDFTFASLVDKRILNNDLGIGKNKLKNEIFLPVEKIGDTDGFPEIFSSLISFVHEKYTNYDSIISSQIDSDDMFRKDFVEKNKSLLKIGNYSDIQESFTLDIRSGKVYISRKYLKMISPFVSVHERIDKLEFLSYKVYHHYVNKYIPGKKYKELQAIQIIHGHNIGNKRGKTEYKINLKDFGT